MNEWFEAEQHAERAHEYFEAGRLDEAEHELRAALSSQPDQAEWLFNLGLTLEASGRYAQAVETFERVVELQDEAPAAMLMMGACLMRMDDAAGALTWLERAADSKPGDAEVYVYMVEALTRLGRHDDAELAFYLGQQLEEDRADLYVALADSLLDRGLHERAVWCLREAARLDPGLAKINARLAEAYAITGRLERARQLYLAELRQDPGDVDVLLDLGDLLVDMHRFDEAGEKYRRVLELEPHHVGAHEALGELAVRLGQTDQAVRSFDVVLRLDSEHDGARTRLAQILLERNAPGDVQRARTLLLSELSARRSARRRDDKPAGQDGADSEPADDARGTEADSGERALELGRLLINAGQHEVATSVLEEAAKRRPRDPEAIHALSVACLRSGNLGEGAELARQVVVLSPSHFAAMYNLALASMEQCDWLRAWYWVRRARRLDADETGLRRLRLKLQLRWLGEIFAWMGRHVGRGVRRLVAMFGRPTRPAWIDRS